MAFPILQPTQAEPTEIDPVCGMKVNPAKAAAKVDYEGKTYYFCGVGCGKRFEAEPRKYLTQDAARQTAAAVLTDGVLNK